jgi:hypothetical protein
VDLFIHGFLKVILDKGFNRKARHPQGAARRARRKSQKIFVFEVVSGQI